MIRRLLMAAALLASTASLAPAQTRVTFIMRNGQRIAGDLTYKGGADYTLNGKDYPAGDIAVIAYVPNDPTPQEVSQIPTVDNNPSELERHVFVMRDGTVVFGKIYKFSPDGNILTFDQREGGRHDVAAGNLARIYVNPAAARVVYAPILAALGNQSNGQGQAGTGGNRNGRRGSTTGGSADFGGQIRVPGNTQWMPSGVNVHAGDTLRFSVTGQVNAPDNNGNRNGGQGRTINRSRSLPLSNAPAGALIGRIENSRPFLISNQASMQMPADGQLYLGINDSSVVGNTGDYYVTVGR
jgi:hypothetical protein